MKTNLLSWLMVTTMMFLNLSARAGTSISGTVYDTDYDGISDATVKISNSDGLIAQGTTNYRGKFDISLNADITGEVTIEASCTGYITDRKTEVLESGVNLSDVELVLSSSTVNLNISVVGTASSWDYLSYVHCAVSLNGNVVAQGDSFYGTASITVNDVVENADYVMTLSKDGYQTLTEHLELIPGQNMTLSYTLYKDGETPPAKVSVIKGNVYCQDDGWAGVADAKVSLLDGENTIGSAMTDEDGDFEISIDGIINGDYTLRVEKDGYETVDKTVNFTNGEASNQDINLKHKSTDATITGIITAAPYGSMVDGATVALYCDDEEVASTESLYGEYTLTISNPGEGTYVLTVDAEGYEPYESEGFTLVSGDALEMNASLVKKEVTEITTFKGIVKDQDGNPVGGVKVTLCNGETVEDYEFTNFGGEFEFSIKRKLEGEFILRTEKYNYSNASYPITISDGTAPYAEISVVCQTATVVVSITDADNGNEIADAEVAILLSGEKLCEAEYSEGVYTATLECVTGNDSYEITASAAGYDSNKTDYVLVPGENKISLTLKAHADGIGSAKAEKNWSIDGRTLNFNAVNPTLIEIYSTDGRLVAKRIAKGNISLTVEPGIYIVKSGSDHFSIYIR